MPEEKSLEWRWLEPFKSMEELEEAVSSLDHWAIPGEMAKYLEILYRLTAFDVAERFEIEHVEYEGMNGSFLGYYNKNVREAARQICSSKFPTDVWERQEDGATSLKRNYPSDVAYLANYVSDPTGLNVICERTNFRSAFEETYNCYGINKRTTIEAVRALEQSAADYLAGNQKKY